MSFQSSNKLYDRNKIEIFNFYVLKLFFSPTMDFELIILYITILMKKNRKAQKFKILKNASLTVITKKNCIFFSFCY